MLVMPVLVLTLVGFFDNSLFGRLIFSQDSSVEVAEKKPKVTSKGRKQKPAKEPIVVTGKALRIFRRM